MDQLTADDVLKLLTDRAQWCRENGESDMRNILSTAHSIKALMTEGKTRDEILAYLADDDEDDDG